jgi:RNA polymerase sigma-70 factor (ECF subfamily)
MVRNGIQSEPPSYDGEGEAAVIRRCQAGDQDAFGQLVRLYAGRAIGAACALLGNREDALDASQDAFVRAWRNIGRFDGRSRFYTWYSTVLRNVCISRLRRRRPAAAELSVEPAGPAEQTDPSILAERNERAKRLWRAILRLPLKHREIIVMSHFQHMAYKDIADSLAVPIGTVMSRLHNARKALRDLLGGQDGPARPGAGDDGRRPAHTGDVR